MESQVPSSTNIKGCKVCFSPYDCNERRPRSLPCGHTFCSKCVSDNLKENKVVCPNCRKEHEASVSTDFPVNFELESVLQEDQTSRQQNTETISNRSVETMSNSSVETISIRSVEMMSNHAIDASRGISKSLKLMKQQFISNMEDISTFSHEACSQLYQYKSQLMEWRKQHQENVEEHQIIVHQSEDMIKHIDKETLRVDETIEEGKEKGQKMKTASNNLTAASTAHEVTTALNEADFYYLILGKWTKEVEKHFPYNKLVTESQKLKERSKSGLLKYSSCLDEKDTVATVPEVAMNQCQNITSPSSKEDNYHEDPTDDECVPPSSTVQERILKAFDDMPVQQVNQTVQTHSTSALEVKDLLNLTPLAKELLESNRVFAVKEDKDKDRMRYARITHDQNQSLCLHVLGNPQCLPQDAFFLQHDEVMKMLDVSSRLTFLELGAGGKSLGRLLIRLSPELEYARQFLLLCTGEMGHSYVKSKFLFVYEKGCKGEYVCLGDYEYNNGSGGKTLMEGVNWDKEFDKEMYEQPFEAGTVEAVHHATEANSAQFYINTRDDLDYYIERYFGRIEEGLSIVTEAISKYPNIKKVSIIDCGVVLPR